MELHNCSLSMCYLYIMSNNNVGYWEQAPSLSTWPLGPYCLKKKTW